MNKELSPLQKISPNLLTPLVSNIEEVNDTFTFNKFTSQPGRLDFVEAMKKVIGDHENYKHWTLFRRK